MISRRTHIQHAAGMRLSYMGQKSRSRARTFLKRKFPTLTIAPKFLVPLFPLNLQRQNNANSSPLDLPRYLLEDCHHVENHSRYVPTLSNSICPHGNPPVRESQKANVLSRHPAGVRTNVQSLLEYSLETKKRNFLETVELQIGLKNYDPQRDKRFSGTVRLPVVPRPNMSIWYV